MRIRSMQISIEGGTKSRDPGGIHARSVLASADRRSIRADSLAQSRFNVSSGSSFSLPIRGANEVGSLRPRRASVAQRIALCEMRQASERTSFRNVDKRYASREGEPVEETARVKRSAANFAEVSWISEAGFLSDYGESNAEHFLRQRRLRKI